MGDSTVAVQPAAQAPPGQPVAIRTFVVLDANGQPVQIQAMTMVDEFNRSTPPMSEATGQALLAAIKALHADFALANGTVGPT